MKDSIICPKIQPIDRLTPDSLEGAMKGVQALPMQQAWLEIPEERLRPGTVRLAHDGERLYVLADLCDEDVWTRSTANQQPLWMLGDAFEMFFRDVSGDRYFELHVSPAGHYLQLHFPYAGAISAGDKKLEDFLWEDRLFSFNVTTGEGGWRVAAAISSGALFGQSLECSEWLASFSRYDYTSDGSAPVLSSTSRHAVCNFHRQDEWKVLTFE